MPIGDYVLDTQRHELYGAGAPIKLRRKVFQVLAYLLAHRDRVVPKQELLEQLWPDQFVGDEALTSCIKTLRQALGGGGGRRASCARCTARAIALWRRSRCGSTSRRTRRRPLLARGDLGAHSQAEGPVGAPHPEGVPLRDSGPPSLEALDGEHKQVTVLCGALAEAPPWPRAWGLRRCTT